MHQFKKYLNGDRTQRNYLIPAFLLCCKLQVNRYRDACLYSGGMDGEKISKFIYNMVRKLNNETKKSMKRKLSK